MLCRIVAFQSRLLSFFLSVPLGPLAVLRAHGLLLVQSPGFAGITEHAARIAIRSSVDSPLSRRKTRSQSQYGHQRWHELIIWIWMRRLSRSCNEAQLLVFGMCELPCCLLLHECAFERLLVLPETSIAFRGSMAVHIVRLIACMEGRIPVVA